MVNGNGAYDALLAPEAQAIMALSSFWRESLMDVLAFAAPDRPLLEIQRHHFHSAGLFSTLDLRVAYLGTGHVGIAWRTAEVTFTAKWCNPLWDLWADITAKHNRIAVMLHEAVANTITPPDLTLDRASLSEAPVLSPPPWPVLAWRLGKRGWGRRRFDG